MGQSRGNRWASVRFAAVEHLRRSRRRIGFEGLGALTKPAARLLIAPQDIRTSDPSIAADVYAGLFALGGRAVRTEGDSVFEVEPPSWLWASELHGFAWLRHLRLAQSALSRANARALLVEWMARPDRRRKTIAAEPLTAARRLISLLSQSPLLLEDSDADFYRRFLRLLAREVRQIIGNFRESQGEERLLSVVALAYYTICTEQSEPAAARMNTLLSDELKAQILPDGGHVGRNPAIVVQLLLDLLPLRQGYVARRTTPPKELIGAIDRMMPMVRMMRHGDGALGLFNGMGVTQPDLVAAALAYDDTRSRAMENAPHSGYQRLASETGTILLMDCAAPSKLAGPIHPHAGTLAFEFSDGPQRFVVNCGGPAPDRDMLQRAARSTPAHSTLSMDDHSSSRFFEKHDRYGRLIGGIRQAPRRISAERQDGPEGVAVLASHDGYSRAFGVFHERQIFVARDGATIIGNDHLAPARNAPVAEHPYVLRFHLHPTVMASLREDRSVLLMAARQKAWLFEMDGAADIAIEESAFFASLETTRRCQQILVSGTAASHAKVRWRFTRLALGPEETR